MSSRNRPVPAARLLAASLVLTILTQACTPPAEEPEQKIAVKDCVPGPEAFCVASDLTESSFQGMNLAEANFAGSNLAGANFDGATLFNVNFSKADLSDASFVGATLVDADFDGATIKNANFNATLLMATRFVSADLSGSSFKGAVATLTDFTEASGVDYAGMYYCGIFLGFGTMKDAPRKFGVCDPKGQYRPTSPRDATYQVQDLHGDVMGSYVETMLPITSRSVGGNPLVAAQRYSYAFAAAAVAAGDARYEKWLESAAHLPKAPSQVVPEIAVISAAIAVSVLQMHKYLSSLRIQTSLATSGMPYQYIYYGRDKIVHKYASYPESLVWNSMLWGTKIGEAVHEAALADPALSAPMVDKNYKQPENPEVFEWVPTPPTYQSPLGFKWGSVLPMISSLRELESCKAPSPYGTTDPRLVIREQAAEVLKLTKNISDADRDLAKFWDDGVGSTSTPPGHWYNIARIILGKKDLSLETTASLFADLSAAVLNATILTWEAKHKWGVVRPVTYIQANLDKEWTPYLMSPPHQEYPSGHASISHAAASVLEDYLGEVGFTDPGSSITVTLAEELDLKPRTYESIEQAAVEAAYSRVIGGIHYPMSASAGRDIGKCAANLLKR